MVGGHSFNGLFFCSVGLSPAGMTARQWSQPIHPLTFVFRPGQSLLLTTLSIPQASGSLYRGVLMLQRTLTLTSLTWLLTVRLRHTLMTLLTIMCSVCRSLVPQCLTSVTLVTTLKFMSLLSVECLRGPGDGAAHV